MTFGNYADLFLTLSDEKDAILQAQHFIITDINQVICWHRGATVSNTLDWYHQFDDSRFHITSGTTIPPKNYSRNFGWYSGELTTSSSYQQLIILSKDVNYVPVEGFFFCAYRDGNDGGKYISIGIHHPSELA